MSYRKPGDGMRLRGFWLPLQVAQNGGFYSFESMDLSECPYFRPDARYHGLIVDMQAKRVVFIYEHPEFEWRVPGSLFLHYPIHGASHAYSLQEHPLSEEP